MLGCFKENTPPLWSVADSTGRELGITDTLHHHAASSQRIRVLAQGAPAGQVLTLESLTSGISYYAPTKRWIPVPGTDTASILLNTTCDFFSSRTLQASMKVSSSNLCSAPSYDTLY